MANIDIKELELDDGNVYKFLAEKDGDGNVISMTYATKEYVDNSISGISGGGSGSGSSVAGISLTLNTSTYEITAQLKDSNNNNVGASQTIDLPLESVVVNGAYDSTNKKVQLTLQNGNTVEFSVADLISGLQSEITSTNKLSSDLVDDTGHTHKFITASERATWNSKQNELTFDSYPYSNSSNPVTSDGIYRALDYCLSRDPTIKELLIPCYEFQNFYIGIILDFHEFLEMPEGLRAFCMFLMYGDNKVNNTEWEPERGKPIFLTSDAFADTVTGYYEEEQRGDIEISLSYLMNMFDELDHCLVVTPEVVASSPLPTYWHLGDSLTILYNQVYHFMYHVPDEYFPAIAVTGTFTNLLGQWIFASDTPDLSKVQSSSGSGGESTEYISFTSAQTLTPAQQQQALANLGLIDVSTNGQ